MTQARAATMLGTSPAAPHARAPEGHGHLLPFARAGVADSEIEAVLDVLRSGWLTTGPRVHDFETAFASHVGAPDAIAISSCDARAGHRLGESSGGASG